MNLKLHLMIRIALLAFFCLLAASSFVLWQAERELQRYSSTTLESVGRQLQVRFTTFGTSFDRGARLSYWDPLADSELIAGHCVKYLDPQGQVVTSSCRGWDKENQRAPAWFAAFYGAVFNPGKEAVRQLSWRGRDYGRLVAAPDEESQIATAWRDVSGLMGLTAITLVALCVLVYFAISRALRPTREILLGLEQLERGDLSHRLPRLELVELQKMSAGFNRLAASLEQSIAEREELTRKLIGVQEEERRYIARELHDEFGQCLAAINAVAASVTQTAEQKFPELVRDGENLTRIVGHMMKLLRDMLQRLRPSGIDELGLIESLRGLVTQCNTRAIQIELDAKGDFEGLPEVIAVSIFRIVQECLTNVSKHAGATKVKVKIERYESGQAGHAGSNIDVTVEDDGSANGLTLARSPGMGLLGMRERVTALGGTLMLQARQSNGLVVRALIPLGVSL